MFIARRDLGIRGQGEGHLKGPSFRAVLPGPFGAGFPHRPSESDFVRTEQ